MERGVTVERIRRIRRNYESQQKKEVVGAENISGISGKQLSDFAKGKKWRARRKIGNSRSAKVTRRIVKGFLPMSKNKWRIKTFAI